MVTDPWLNLCLKILEGIIINLQSEITDFIQFVSSLMFLSNID